MALSTALIRHLDNCDEPLPKRLKLAENVFYNSDLPIVHKEELLFQWLCHAFPEDSSSTVWATIFRCLVLEPKNFTKLSSETKGLFIKELIKSFNEYPETQVINEMLKCSKYILTTTNIQSYTKDNEIVALIEALLVFINNILNLSGEKENKFEDTDIAIECAEQAISTFASICRQNLSEKKRLIPIFIEQIFFPLSVLVENLKLKEIFSKLIIESQKCIRRLLLDSMKGISLASTEQNTKSEETQAIFDILRKKTSTSKLEHIKATYACLFQCVVNTFQQNSTLIDIILRNLLEIIEQKEHCKQVLICLLKHSSDVSYNFDYELEGICLKFYLTKHIQEVVTKKSRFKHSDYELLYAIANLNPLIVEDEMEAILKRILWEEKMHNKEVVAYENLVTELWKSSVRLRRHQKFLSKFLIAIDNYEEKEITCSELRNQLNLPDSFILEFSEDLKSRTTKDQLLAMFSTLLFHLKSNCITKLKMSGPTTQVCITAKVVAKLLTSYVEHAHFLDSSLPQDCQTKFYQVFSDLRNTLALFCEVLCETSDKHDEIIFMAFFDIIKVWCKMYNLLQHYLQNTALSKLDFPMNESQFKQLKKVTKRCTHHDCGNSLNQLCLLKSMVYRQNDPLIIKNEIVTKLWPHILENHFQILESFTEIQILNLTFHFVEEASRSNETLTKWTCIFSRNFHRLTKIFVTATALQIVSNISNKNEDSSLKTIQEKINLEELLKSLKNSDSAKKVLKVARKEIFKQNFNLLNIVDLDEISRNLMLLSSLPLSYLNTSIRSFLFMVLYTLEEETGNTTNLQKLFTNLYLDLLRQNDIEIISNVLNPIVFIHHFKDNKPVLLKIFKLSLTHPTILSFLEEFISTEKCCETISCTLLLCIDSSKKKASSSEHKKALNNLSLKLSNKIAQGLHEEINDPDKISGVRISLKVILSEKAILKSNLKRCIEMTLQKAVQNFRTADSRLIQESLQLSLIALSHREKFDINESTVKKLCFILIHNPDKKIFSAFLEVLKDKEFDYFAKTLSNETKQSLASGDTILLNKFIMIWKSLSKTETKTVRSKSICASVYHLFNELIALEMKETTSVYLLQLCRAIITSKRMISLSDRLVDLILTASMESLDELSANTKLMVCQEALGFCLDFIRSKVDFLVDRLPILINLFKKILQNILNETKEINTSNEHVLRILAVDIEKFCTFFAKMKKDVARISPYLIADIINASSQAGVLPSFLKVSIDSSLSHLLSNCDRHAISYLSRTLPVSTQQVFKIIYDNYLKYHKFTGKI